MKVNKLHTISPEQRDKLIKLGVDVDDRTLVLEALAFFRSIKAIDLSIKAPFYVTHQPVSAYYTGQVSWYGEISEERSGYLKWSAPPVHSWEEIDSLALDYIIESCELETTS